MKQTTLAEEFCKAISKFNPVAANDGVVFQTKAGLLWCRIYSYDDKDRVSSSSWIAARFFDTALAKKVFGVVKDFDNTSRLAGYTGKWNWHDFQFHPYQKRMNKKELREAGMKMIVAFIKEIDEMKSSD